MLKKRIQWRCVLGEKWEWVTIDGTTINQATIGNELSGEIELVPNKDYWHLCAVLNLGTTAGFAALRCFQEGTEFYVQAMTEARGEWNKTALPSTQRSTTRSRGGINLHTQLLSLPLSE